MRDKRMFCDPQTDQEIFATRVRRLSFFNTVQVLVGETVIATIRPEVFGHVNPTVRCYHGDAQFTGDQTSAPMLFEAVGDPCRPRDRDFSDANGDEIAASRNNMCWHFFPAFCVANEYEVECEAGANCGLIWAAIIAIDDLIDAQKGNN
eukprot:CAMPEP_0178373752 /NCGR_PEP_ID=MMETSP0689_2-20121128/2024_1 /TAXON_ID=160604 /ORGANISM="Amphidinium massartii, Strain CS-259" /LENGTH=148 /DNA_ID=CAMNT_0019993703 /DNA_START=196 /DNA_END=642 /DNA_ORIENTATION=-